MIAVRDDALARLATYTIPSAASALDVGPDGRIVIARQDAADARDVPVQLWIGTPDGEWSNDLLVHLAGGALRATRWTDDGNLLVLSEGDESELMLIDGRTGRDIARASIDAAMCDDGWLPDIAAGYVLVHGHCACQENELELVRFDGKELESLDWFVHAPEGLTPLGIADGELLAIENDPRALARRRDLSTGEITAERDLSEEIDGYVLQPFVDVGHEVVLAIQGADWVSSTLCLLDRRTLEITAEAPLSDGMLPIGFVDSRRVVIAGGDAVALLVIEP